MLPCLAFFYEIVLIDYRFYGILSYYRLFYSFIRNFLVLKLREFYGMQLRRKYLPIFTSASMDNNYV